MITQDLINKFYSDVNGLRLKFPVAEISRATKESKGNVSRILKRQIEPSESFIKRFYDSFKNVSREMPADIQNEILTNLKEVREYTIAILSDMGATNKVVLSSLERLEGKPEGTLNDYADSIAERIQNKLLQIQKGK